MKFVFVPDSFKGTLSATDVCRVLDEARVKILPSSTSTNVPIADGGEGTLEVLRSLSLGDYVEVKAHNSFMEERLSKYLLSTDGVAYIELADCAGLPEVYDRRNPLLTTTFGVGEQIKDAVDKGAKKIVIAIGGSSTNDGGVGIACALGGKFYDVFGREFLPTGGTLSDIADVDFEPLEAYRSIDISVMCDVDTVLLGEVGASAVYGPQKGATTEDVYLLDEGLKRLNDFFIREYGKDFSTLSGGGAAGGAGAGLSAFLGAKLLPGIEVVLSAVRFDELVQDCDIVVTGEGKFDEQSFMGKVVNGVSNYTKRHGKKLVVVAGLVSDEAVRLQSEYGIVKSYATNPDKKPFDEVKGSAREDLMKVCERLFLDVKEGKI